jgi:hypothetical protein
MSIKKSLKLIYLQTVNSNSYGFIVTQINVLNLMVNNFIIIFIIIILLLLTSWAFK